MCPSLYAITVKSAGFRLKQAHARAVMFKRHIQNITTLYKYVLIIFLGNDVNEDN